MEVKIRIDTIYGTYDINKVKSNLDKKFAQINKVPINI